MRLSPDTQSALLAHPWPGNIRELENVIHHAVLVCQDNLVQTARLLGISRNIVRARLIQYGELNPKAQTPEAAASTLPKIGKPGWDAAFAVAD